LKHSTPQRPTLKAEKRRQAGHRSRRITREARDTRFAGGFFESTLTRDDLYAADFMPRTMRMV